MKPEAFHALYCQLTGYEIPYTLSRMFEWERFALQFTHEDLRLVVGYIKKLKKQGRNCRSLIMRSLISGPNSLEFFAEDLAEAKRQARKPVPVERDGVLASSGRPEVEKPARSAADILAGEQAFAAFLALKKTL